MGRHLGQDKSLIDARLPFRVYRRLFGAEDMHSHFRWAAVSPLIDLRAARTLEVGGGDGRIGFEAVRSGLAGELVITEFDPKTLDEARITAMRGGFYNVTVSQQDLRQLEESSKFDQVLAIDVLEHIDDATTALAEIARVTKPGGRLVISVPTPLYPRVFGRSFHEHLGHVRDGYWLEDLEVKLQAANFRVIEYAYYTGPAVARACRLFYGLGIPYLIGVVWAPLVRPMLMRFDRRVDDKRGASLALVAKLIE